MSRSITALALIACLSLVSFVQAATDLSMNLRYNDPADPNEGGLWWLVAKTDTAGIAGLTINFDPNTIGLVGHEVGFSPSPDPNYGIPTVTPGDIGHELLGGDLGVNIFSDPNGTNYVEFLYAQFPPSYVLGVGSGTASIGADPLNNSAWDGATIIASGAFDTVRPVLSSVNGAASELVDPNSNPVLCDVGGGCLTYTVRGDALKGTVEEDPNEGLLAGDANRDGSVDFLDFSALSGNYLVAGPWGWDDADFNDDAAVDFLDFSFLSGNYLKNSNPPTIATIPEPSSCILALAAVCLSLTRRR